MYNLWHVVSYVKYCKKKNVRDNTKYCKLGFSYKILEVLNQQLIGNK